MWNAVKEMLASKKALATLASIVVFVLGKFGLDMDAETLVYIVGPLWGYVFAQGLADKGKEAAKVASAAAKELSDRGIGTSPPVDPQ